MTVRLKLKVNPKARHNQIQGWIGDTLKVCVTAAPEKGKANQAVLRLLARHLRQPVSQMHIVAGQQHSNKTLLIDNLDDPELHALLAKVLK